jgi:hypothetical protein
MNKIFLIITFLYVNICTSQSNVTISYKSYSYEFEADDYPKSIIDYYKKQNNIIDLSDRQIAIKINANLIFDNLIDNVLRYAYLENLANLSEASFNSVKLKLKAYYKYKNIHTITDKLLIDRTQQYIADSIVLSKYNGKIYYDILKKTPKPLESHSKCIIDLIQKNNIQITDEYLKKELLDIAENLYKDFEEIKVDFNTIESWLTK